MMLRKHSASTFLDLKLTVLQVAAGTFALFSEIWKQALGHCHVHQRGITADSALIIMAYLSQALTT
jgi:hypothetical protein